MAIVLTSTHIVVLSVVMLSRDFLELVDSVVATLLCAFDDHTTINTVGHLNEAPPRCPLLPHSSSTVSVLVVPSLLVVWSMLQPKHITDAKTVSISIVAEHFLSVVET